MPGGRVRGSKVGNQHRRGRTEAYTHILKTAIQELQVEHEAENMTEHIMRGFSATNRKAIARNGRSFLTTFSFVQP